MMYLLLGLSIVLSTNFTSYCIGKEQKLPESISAMVFSLRHRWLWSIWLWTVVFSLAPSLIEAVPEAWQFLAFLFLVCMLFTGAFPLFDTGKRRWHYPLAFAGGVLSQACVCFVCPWWLLAWLFMAAYIACGLLGFNESGCGEYGGKGVFIAEEICKITVYGSILTSIMV